ncbi:MAG: serine hydroxymethyltransferase, partial [Deltaproteobacteria bacterium]
DNSRVLAETLSSRGFDLVTGGSDNHLILIDLTGKDVPGKVAAQALDRAGIVANYNSVPFDTRKPFDPSGVRLGTPAITSRGMGADEMKRLGNWMADVVDDVENEALMSKVAGEVKELCDQFPAPGVPVH